MSQSLSYFASNGLCYTDKGHGPCLIFLHGFLETSSIWDYYSNYFCKNYRTICIDLPGHGKSKFTHSFESMEDIADGIYEVLTNLKIAKATIIGHSMGGYVGLSFARLYPEVVSKLILVNSTTYADSLLKQEQRDRTIQLIKRHKDTFIQLAIKNQFSSQDNILFQERINDLLTKAKTSSENDIITCLKALKNRPDSQDLLYKTNLNIIFILGKKDTIVDYQMTYQQIPDPQRQLISLESGHMPYIESEEELVQALQEALDI